MAIFLNPTDVVCEVDRLVARDDGETVFGSEPYLWSFFFKIDGETITAAITIGNQGIDLDLDGDPTIVSPDEGSHGNLNLAGGSVDAGGLLGTRQVVDIPAAVGRFETTLQPIPTTIQIEPDSWIAEAIDDAVLSLQDIIDSLMGDTTCPSVDEPSQLLASLGAEFVTDVVGGLPGAFGGLYLLMEEDFTSEDVAEDARRELRDTLRDELAAVVEAISIENQAPSEATMEEIEIRITNAVTDVIAAGINWWWLLLGTIGLAIALDQDDPLGSAQPMMTHLDVALEGEQDIDEPLLPEGHGDWSLRGRIGVSD